MIKFFLATGATAKTKTWRNAQWEWSKFVERLRKPKITNETWEHFMSLSKEEQGAVKDVGGYVGAYLENGKRSPSCVKSKGLLTLDIDFAGPDFFDKVRNVFPDTAAVMHGTHKCKIPDVCRFRLLMPLSREVTPDEYAAISRKVAERIGLSYFDRTTFEVNRLMFWQSTPMDVEYYFEEQKGLALNAEDILNSYFDWRDQSEWCTYDRERPQALKEQEDPLLKKGIVGDFCRTYTIEEAIAKFLPDTYDSCDMSDRYTYKGGTTYGGAIVYDNKFLYSHHGTDPASGQLCNAFDLVRLHKFTSDEKSFTRMSDIAVNDDKVKEFILKERMSYISTEFDKEEEIETEVVSEKVLKGHIGIVQHSLFDLAKAHKYTQDQSNVTRTAAFEKLFGDPSLKFKAKRLEKDPDWAKKLDVDRKGNYLPTSNNLNLILVNDPVLERAFTYNSFANKRYIRKSVPWRHVNGTELLRDADYSGLRNYIECIYGISAPSKVEDALNLQFENCSYHPVIQYLRGLEWDGVERIDTLLHDYFAVENNDYHSQVMRKMLAGAVNRVVSPGCKFDLVMMFTGAQGVYKSTFIKKLGKGFSSDSFSTVSGKEAFEQLQGAWLIEIAELSAMRKAEVESVKHFITKTEDTYRPAYGRCVETFPRQCVFFGSTNSMAFLKDRTGNRRYLPVQIKQTRYKRLSKKSVVDDLTDYEIDQIWAEAVELVLAGEKMYLEGEVEREAEQRQKAHVEYDDRIGMIECYLNTPKPTDWDSWSLSERRLFLENESWREDEDGAFELSEYVSPIEIWMECMGGSRKDFDYKHSRFINESLETLGYEIAGTKQRGWYGRQRCYRKPDY